jgi:hypothetical protein
MPSDHSSIAARHRARTLSRAKSLRKHTRWLVQQQEKHQSQPDLSISQADKLELSQTLRRAISLKSRRTSNATSTVSPFASISTLVDPNYPFTPVTARSRSGSGFPWREVQWTGNQKKIGTRISTARGLVLTPYPPTTTRVVSRATAVGEGELVAGKVDAMSFLGKTRRKYLPLTSSAVNEQVKVTNTAAVQIPRTKKLVRPMSSGNHVTNDSDTTCSTTTTSSSQVSDSGALMYLYAATAAHAQRERQRQDSSANFKSPPRAKTYSHAKRGQWEVEGQTQAPLRNARQGRQQREQRRPLLPPASQRQVSDRGRDKSPQRHQRDRHPRLIFPYAPGSGLGFGWSQSHPHSQANTMTYGSHHDTHTHAHQHNPSHTSIHKHIRKHRLPAIRIRKFVDGYWRWVTLPASFSHHDLSKGDTTGGMRYSSESRRSRNAMNGESEVDRGKGEELWSKTRSSILGLGTGFWPAGPRRIL